MLKEIEIKLTDSSRDRTIKRRKNKIIKSLNKIYDLANEQESFYESNWLVTVLNQLTHSVETGETFE